MAKSSSSSDNEVYDDSFCSKSCKKNTENLNKKIIKLNEELSDCETDLYNYKRGLSQVEGRLVEFKEQEIKFCERIRVLERDLELKDYKIENLINELEEVKKERDGIDSKLEKFVNSSKDLDQMPTPSIKVSKDVSIEQKSNSDSSFEKGGSVGNITSKPKIRVVKETGCPSASKVNHSENSRKPTVKNFVPKAVLMKTGMRPLNAARPGVGVNAAKQKAAYNVDKGIDLMLLRHQHVGFGCQRTEWKIQVYGCTNSGEAGVQQGQQRQKIKKKSRRFDSRTSSDDLHAGKKDQEDDIVFGKNPPQQRK
ncbi:hypothetical protein Tco_0195684 [Tanacetum coccineum]